MNYALNSDSWCSEDLFPWLPKLRPGWREALDRPLALQGCRRIIKHLSPCPAPTVDGIPAKFWRTVGGAVGGKICERLFLKSLWDGHPAAVSRLWCHFWLNVVRTASSVGLNALKLLSEPFLSDYYQKHPEKSVSEKKGNADDDTICYAKTWTAHKNWFHVHEHNIHFFFLCVCVCSYIQIQSEYNHTISSPCVEQ